VDVLDASLGFVEVNGVEVYDVSDAYCRICSKIISSI
jgi:hypothetical protein